MHLFSTKDSEARVSWSDGVLKGIAPDGGLLMPSHIPTLSRNQLNRLAGVPFPTLAYELAHLFLSPEVSDSILADICSDAFAFDLPLKGIAPDTYILELFHGPTCAFKDFGARFMARLFRHFLRNSSDPLTVLVATSGDTGSAVAHAFFDPSPNPPIRVAILFPKGKVSAVQEKQMTTLQHNISTFEVDGTFDDCQALVKTALTDKVLCGQRAVTSANSINIARLLPQMFYYIYASLKLPSSAPPVFSVPSGNLGNLTGGLIGHIMGMRAARFIAACNINAPFLNYLLSGSYTPHSSHETLSNAMDVGAPSNFARIASLYGHDLTRMRSSIVGESISDDETIESIAATYRETGYIADPHTAVGLLALRRYREREGFTGPGIALATAHAAKFSSTVERAIGLTPEIPPQIANVCDKEGLKYPLRNSYDELRERLIS
jgi:threonine synthase